MMKTPSFAIMGGSVWGNRGAEAMLMTVVGRLRAINPETKFNVYSIYPREDARLVQDAKIVFYSGKPLALALFHFPLALLAAFLRFLHIKLPIPPSLNALRNADCLLDMGGITFSDGRTLQLLYNIFSIWPAMLLGVPVIKLSQALGPFRKTLNRRLAHAFLPKCTQIFTRGALSESFLQGIPEAAKTATRGADIAFLYRASDSLSAENEDKAEALAQKMASWRSEGQHVICIAPSSLVLKQSRKQSLNYPGKLLNLVLSTRNEPYRYVFLANSTRSGSAETMNNDLVALEAMRNYFKTELDAESFSMLEWADYDLNTRGVRRILQEADGLVASRFHGMVAGLSCTVPVLVIGWSHKYRETLADFGLQDWAIDYKNTDLRILELYRRFLEELPQLKDQILAQLPAVQASSARQFEYLRQAYFEE